MQAPQCTPPCVLSMCLSFLGSSERRVCVLPALPTRPTTAFPPLLRLAAGRHRRPIPVQRRAGHQHLAAYAAHLQAGALAAAAGQGAAGAVGQACRAGAAQHCRRAKPLSVLQGRAQAAARRGLHWRSCGRCSACSAGWVACVGRQSRSAPLLLRAGHAADHGAGPLVLWPDRHHKGAAPVGACAERCQPGGSARMQCQVAVPPKGPAQAGAPARLLPSHQPGLARVPSALAVLGPRRCPPASPARSRQPAALAWQLQPAGPPARPPLGPLPDARPCARAAAPAGC